MDDAKTECEYWARILDSDFAITANHMMATIMKKIMMNISTWLTDQRRGNGSSPPVSRRAASQCLGAEKTNINQLGRQI